MPIKKYYPGQRFKDGFAAKTAENMRSSLDTDGSAERPVSKLQVRKYKMKDTGPNRESWELAQMKVKIK